MNCKKCSGKMSFELFEDIEDDTGKLYFYGWRCIHCGEIVDPIILSNRKERPAPKKSRARRKIQSVSIYNRKKTVINSKGL
ncbi:MAG: hypothetical protein ACE5EA_02275 [Nitrospirota bacterium]